MKSARWTSWKAAQEIGDYEEPEPEIITEWNYCKIHGKYPTEAVEYIWEWDEGYGGMVPLWICPLCYSDQMYPNSTFWTKWRVFYESNYEQKEMET